MAQVNLEERSIQIKIVYWGPGLAGKTTNLESLHGRLPAGQRGELIEIADTAARTLFFDYLPLEAGSIGEFRVAFQLYTVSGHEASHPARMAVLAGADGVVFVADPQPARERENGQSLDELLDALAGLAAAPRRVPIVMQYNKADLVSEERIADLDSRLNVERFPATPASALTGDGVVETLRSICQLAVRAL